MIPLSKLLQQKGALIISVLLAAAVFAAFLPVLHNGFVNYDDPVYVYSNPHVTGGLTWSNVQWAFRTLDGGIWHPLTWLSIMLDCELFGLSPGGHHLTSLLLHIASTVLLFLVLRRMTGSQWRSALVAALFGLHPLHVESVVWASERKDVLSAFFFMLTLLAYAEYVAARMEDGGWRVEGRERKKAEGRRQKAEGRTRSTFWYVLSLVCFTLGLMSKSMLVTVPVILLLLDFWPLGRLKSRNQKAEGGKQNPPTPSADAPRLEPGPSTFNLLLEKLPFVVLGVAVGLTTLVGQKQLGAMAPDTELPLLYRAGNAVLSYAHYLVQTVWPLRLAVFYSLPRGISPWTVAALLLVGLALSAGLWRWARPRPYLAVGWLWYLVALLPVIGLLQVGSQAHADRYTYLPLVGIFVALAWGASELAAAWQWRPGLLAGGAALLLFSCALLTSRQTGYWKDSFTLWRHALMVTRSNEVAHASLGALLDKQGRTAEAIPEYQESLRLAPRQAGVRVRLGVALAVKGRVDEALVQFQEAVKLEPNNLDARYNLGVALLSKQRYDEALQQFREALRIRPGYPRAESNVRAAQAAKAQATKGMAAPKRP